MQTIHTDFQHWLRRQAHLLPGAPLEFEDFSCIPLLPESGIEEGTIPMGFVVWHSGIMEFLNPPSEGEANDLWEKVFGAWEQHELHCGRHLPTECWLG